MLFRVRCLATTQPVSSDYRNLNNETHRSDLVRAKFLFVKARWNQRWVRLQSQRMVRKFADPAKSFLHWVDWWGKLSSQSYGTAVDFSSEFSQSSISWFRKNPFRAMGDFFVASSLAIMFIFGIMQTF